VWFTALAAILVSMRVRDLIAGSEIRLEDRGRLQLKGVEGAGSCSLWQPFDGGI
jgi:hypothetical protein